MVFWLRHALRGTGQRFHEHQCILVHLDPVLPHLGLAQGDVTGAGLLERVAAFCKTCTPSRAGLTIDYAIEFMKRWCTALAFKNELVLQLLPINCCPVGLAELGGKLG